MIKIFKRDGYKDVNILEVSDLSRFSEMTLKYECEGKIHSIFIHKENFLVGFDIELYKGTDTFIIDLKRYCEMTKSDFREVLDNIHYFSTFNPNNDFIWRKYRSEKYSL